MNGIETSLLDVVNCPGMFRNGERLRDYGPKDILPLSGRLIPEFNGRRSIRDMFSKKASFVNPVTAEKAQSPAHLPSSDDYGSAPLDFVPLSGSFGYPPAEKNTTMHSAPNSKAPVKTKDLLNLSPRSKRSTTENNDTGMLKRLKSNHTQMKMSNKHDGQQSLKGFFKPVSTSTGTSQSMYPDYSSAASISMSEARDVQEEAVAQSPRPSRASSEEGAKSVESMLPQSLSIAIDGTTFQEYDKVHDPIESKASWSKLFAKPTPPQCDSHDEPCKVMVTKKPGVNCGRSFWICSKPLGPLGVKENGTQWRCKTFIWCSDWTSP